jgi:hypothetical protein
MGPKKGQMFIVSVIFLIGMVFVVQQALFSYSEIDMSSPFEIRDGEVFGNMADVVNKTITGSYSCNGTKDSFNERMEKLKASFLEEYGREYAVEILYTLDCSRWSNAPPDPAPLALSLDISRQGRDTRGTFQLYHNITLTSTRYIEVPSQNNNEANILNGIPFKELPSDSLLALSTQCSRGFINYVCGTDGKTYQNKCEADFFGTPINHNGYCAQSKEFAKSLFSLPNANNIGSDNTVYFNEVNSPYILYETINYKILITPSAYKSINEYIGAVYLVTYSDILGTSSDPIPRNNIAISPLVSNLRVLIGIYDFGTTGFPQSEIQPWTLDALNRYENYFNTIRANNNLPAMNIDWNIAMIKPTMSSSDFNTLVNQPSSGVNTIIDEVLTAANKQKSDIDILIIGAFDTSFVGGYYRIKTGPNDVNLIYAPISLNGQIYSTNKADALKAIDRFYGSFIGVITHEMLHFFGGDAQHRTFFGDAIQPAQKVIKNQGGYNDISSANLCDYFYTSDYEYSVVPQRPELQVTVGQEPTGFFRAAGTNGDCLALPASNPSSNLYNFIGKDVNRDGKYEIVSVFQPLNNLVLEQIGWKDVDGDGIVEIIDPIPYGGVTFKQLSTVNKDIIKTALQNNQKIKGTVERAANDVIIGQCKFTNIDIKDEAGTITTHKIPVICEKYNELINDIYMGKITYGFILVNDGDYGQIAIPLIPDPINFP